MILRRLRSGVLALAHLRRAGAPRRLDGTALALREDLGALLTAVERHMATCTAPVDHTATGLGFAVHEARRSVERYDARRRPPRGPAPDWTAYDDGGPVVAFPPRGRYAHPSALHWLDPRIMRGHGASEGDPTL